jgi:hypothetical protein
MATILAAILGVALIGIVVIVGANLDQVLIKTPVVGYFWPHGLEREPCNRKTCIDIVL